MRILYVAFTRAKEKLIITGIKKDFQKQKEKLCQQIERYQKKNQKINPILVKKYSKYIDWILLVYFYETDKMQAIAELKIETKKDVLNFCQKRETKTIDVVAILEKEEKDREEIKKIDKVLNTNYAYELATKIPTKCSVTNIKQEEQQDKIEISFPVPKFTGKEEDIKLTGAQKGTLLHLCMQKLEETKTYNLQKVKEFIHNLVEKEMITPKEAQNINPIPILKFTQSKIWQDMKQAKEIQREKPFYMTIPAKEIYLQDVSEDILVQGMIDLYYINQKDELILVDYKTDFVETERELLDKYQKQLALYKEALEEALQRKVQHVYIYSTFLGKELEVLK